MIGKLTNARVINSECKCPWIKCLRVQNMRCIYLESFGRLVVCSFDRCLDTSQPRSLFLVAFWHFAITPSYPLISTREYPNVPILSRLSHLQFQPSLPPHKTAPINSNKSKYASLSPLSLPSPIFANPNPTKIPLLSSGFLPKIILPI